MASKVVETVVGIVRAMDSAERSELMDELIPVMGRGGSGKASGGSRAPAWAKVVTGFDYGAKGMDMFPGDWTRLGYKDRSDGSLGLTFKVPPTDGAMVLFGLRRNGEKLYALTRRAPGTTFDLAVGGRQFEVYGAELVEVAETVGELADEVEAKGLLAST